MLNQFSSIGLLNSNVFNMQNLKDLLIKVNEVLFIPCDYISSDYKEIPYECIPGLKMKLRALNEGDISKILSKLESSNELNILLLKSIQTTIINNEELFTVSEVLSHGITYSDATEKIKTIIANLKQLIDGSMVCQFNGASAVLQICLDNDNLDSLILKILKNINKKIVLMPSVKSRGVLSPFLLVYFIHQQNAELMNKITFILPQKPIFTGDEIVCTETWIHKNRDFLHIDKSLNIEFDERKSCFFILGNSNLFSAVANYVNLLGSTFSNTRKVPQLCLVQENVYEKFINLLKNYLSKSTDLKLLDRNRQIAVNYCEDQIAFEELLKSLRESSILSTLSLSEPCGDYSYFYPTIVVDNCQPQQKIFYDDFANRFCSFILTFRTCQEGIMLANQLYQERDSVYLWTESISQCFSLKKLLNYDEIFVNIAQNYAMLTGETNYKYTCKSSFFVSKKNSVDDKFLSVNDISGKTIELKSNSTWRTESFYYRYSRVIEMMNKMVSAGLLSQHGGKFLLEYLENNVKPFQFNYLVRDSLNKLTESYPVGCVIVDLGNFEFNDNVVETLLLVWLFGNDMIVVSNNDIDTFNRCFSDGIRKPTVSFVQGRLQLDVVAQCSFVDSIICFDDSVSKYGFIDREFKMRLYYQDPTSVVPSVEMFNELVSFVRKQKSLYILSGDVGII